MPASTTQSRPETASPTHDQAQPLITCSKVYRDVPFAHRQHLHQGHCSRIHGHNWTIKITFACHELDSHGFVVDFGNLKYLKQWILDHLDHACLLSCEDPLLEAVRNIDPSAFSILEVPNASCEGVAVYLYEEFSKMLCLHETGRVWIDEIELHEDSKNMVVYRPGPRT